MVGYVGYVNDIKCMTVGVLRTYTAVITTFLFFLGHLFWTFTKILNSNPLAMILGHGANTMTLEEARMKLCAQAK